MADLDTRAKRESVIGGHLFFLRILPLADGSDAATEAERAQLAGHYNGIATVVAAGPPAGTLPMMGIGV